MSPCPPTTTSLLLLHVAGHRHPAIKCVKCFSQDLRFVFGRLVGQGTTRAQLDAMVRSAMRTWDANTDGKLSREEFARLVSPDELSAQMTVLLE
jgi:hypothetical protein